MAYSHDYFRERALDPMWRIEARHCQRLAGQGTVIELGCGHGDLLALIQPIRGIGIDLNPAAIAQAGAIVAPDNRGAHRGRRRPLVPPFGCPGETKSRPPHYVIWNT